MPFEQTQRTMVRYFDEMDGGDLARVLATDATWTTAETGALIHGSVAVRDYIDALHHLMLDTQTRPLVVGEDTAHLEGDCLVSPDGITRTAWCLAYDVAEDKITAMRLYGPLESLVVHPSPDP